MKTTKVIFRKFDNPCGFVDSDVIALFPEEKTTDNFIQSYQNIGQHSGASPELITELDKASCCEYKNLYNELVSIGYKNIEIIDYENCINYTQPAIEEPRESGIPLKTRVSSNDMKSWIAIVYEAIGELGIDFDEPSQDELNTALAWIAEEFGVTDIVDFLESRGL